MCQRWGMSYRRTRPAKRLGYLIAHRPGFVAPTLLARKIATFDHLTRGRLAVHIITGKSDDEQHGDGDFSPKDERLRHPPS
jgi:alkanesulfonate monooxygenase